MSDTSCCRPQRWGRQPYTAVCSWESRQIPNLSHGVRLLAPLLRHCRFQLPTWLETERRRSCKPDHAGANPAVGLKPCRCDEQYGSLRDCRTRFDSSAGHLIHNYVLGVWRIRTRPCEGRGPGSIPGGDTFHFDNTTLMLDGRAAACKAVFSEFDSHRCLFHACLDAVIAGGALGSRVSLTYSVNGF